MCRLHMMVGLGGTKKNVDVAEGYKLHLHTMYTVFIFSSVLSACLQKWKKRKEKKRKEKKRKESNSQVLFLRLNLLRWLDILGSLISKCM